MKKLYQITFVVCTLALTSCVAPTGPNTQLGALGGGAGSVIGNSYER